MILSLKIPSHISRTLPTIHKQPLGTVFCVARKAISSKGAFSLFLPYANEIIRCIIFTYVHFMSLFAFLSAPIPKQAVVKVGSVLRCAFVWGVTIYNAVRRYFKVGKRAISKLYTFHTWHLLHYIVIVFSPVVSFTLLVSSVACKPFAPIRIKTYVGQ